MKKTVLGSLVLSATLFIGCGGGDSSCCDAPALTESGMTPPVAQITGLSDTTVSIGQTLSGEGLASYDRDEEGTVVGYKWTVNGEDYSTERNPSFTFNNPGTYEVCLTVIDNDGLDSVNEECRTITVLGKNEANVVPPTAVITMTNINPDGSISPCSVDHKRHKFSCENSHDNDTIGSGDEIRECMWNVRSYRIVDGKEKLYRDCVKEMNEFPDGFCVCDGATKIEATLTVVDNDGQTHTTTKVYPVKR
jgi:PKD repeat protein